MEESNKRIVKNTLFLYIRMIVTMCISFFMTRVVLEKLGVSDYGIYNVVGGFVSMFTVLNSVLQTGTRRFLALNLGKGEELLLKKTFSTAFVIHLLVAGIIFIFAETIGLWFLNTSMNFEEGRLVAANWVYQFSVISVCLAITQTPFTAAVTAHERFNIYAYMSVFESAAKLVAVYLLITIPGDKLIIYAALLLIISLINIIIYRIYCIRQFTECCFSTTIDKSLFREMLTFSGWSTTGHLSAVLNGHGISVLLNLFFNTAINAARGLANTVTFTIQQLVGGFITAAEPQLVKYFGSGETEKFHKLIFNVSQYTLFLLAIFVVPVFLEIDYVLQLWLTEVPNYTSIFIKISMLTALISYSNKMVDQGVVAMGKMKQSALWTSSIYLLNVPLVYLVLKLGGNPASVYLVGITPMILAFMCNLYILARYNKFPALQFFFLVFMKNILLVFIAAIIPLLIQMQLEEGFIRFMVVCLVSVLCTFLVLYFWGLNKEVQKTVLNKIKSYLNK